MEEDLQKQLHGAIQSELEELRSSEAKLSGSTGPVEPDRAIGRLTRMDAIQDKEMKGAQLAKLRLRIERLQRALERLDEAGYGTCGRCKQPIPVERLLIVPEAVFCVRCSA